MSDTNGNAPSPILSLENARASKTRKGNDFITVQQAYDMVIQECAKVHQHYLEQIPTFVARMIQDALLTYGLIVPQPGADIAPEATVVAPVVSENTGGDTPLADSKAPAQHICACSLPNEFFATNPRKCTTCGGYNRKDVEAAPAEPAA